MTDEFNTSLLGEVLKQVAADFQGKAAELQELDAQIGDGDLGITAELAGKAMTAFLETAESADIGEFLIKCGFAVNKASPSTFGTLLAFAFIGAGRAIGKKEEIEAGDLVKMGSGAVETIKARGKAEVGDKTLLDSLVPAVQALEKGLGADQDLPAALEQAVTAAREGMEATAGMKAKFGRASWRPDATAGLRDAGAAAMYYIVESFARHLQEQTG